MSQIEPTPEGVTQTRTYTNPVYEGYFADPFVWEYQGVYYAIGTGAAEAQGQVDEIAQASGVDSTNKLRVFPLLRSLDFLNWHPKLLTAMASSTFTTQWGTRTRIISCALQRAILH